MGENNTTFKCTGDCLSCHPDQRQYCAAQFTHDTMLMVEQTQQAITALAGTVEELKSKVEAIQNNESLLFRPVVERSETVRQNIAQ